MRISPCVPSKYERNITRAAFVTSLLAGVGCFVGGFFVPPLWIPSGIMLGAALSAYQAIVEIPDTSTNSGNVDTSNHHVDNNDTSNQSSESISTPHMISKDARIILVSNDVNSTMPPTRPNTPMFFQSRQSSPDATVLAQIEESPKAMFVV